MRVQVASGRTLLKYWLSKIVEIALKILKRALPLKTFNPNSKVLTICYKTYKVTTLGIF